jgi:hypothetical protein
VREFTTNERIILDFLVKNTGKWFTPSVIARKADTREHYCSWASHICLRLTKWEILRHNSFGGYCYTRNAEITYPKFHSNRNMNNKLTDNEKGVLELLKEHAGQWISPSSIEWMITSKKHSSSWASRICLRLVDKGLIKRNKKGQYLYEEYGEEVNWAALPNLKHLARCNQGLHKGACAYKEEETCPVLNPRTETTFPKFHRNMHILTCSELTKGNIVHPLKPQDTEISGYFNSTVISAEGTESLAERDKR